jgi:hypothetical protein
MQKISTYLYKNRYQLVADLAGFTTEYKIVYQRNIKVYRGIDNVIEFDIKNADQKRIDLSTLDSISMNVMDSNGYALLSSPYTVDPMDQETLKGIATVTIPSSDLTDLENQFLSFSITGVKDSSPVLFYGDTKFGAAGTIELLGGVAPIERKEQVYTDFYGFGDYDNIRTTYSSSSIPLKFKSAVQPNHVHITVDATNFVGKFWVEATTDEVVGGESFTYKGVKIYQTEYNGLVTVELPIIDITGYTYLRVCWNKKMSDHGTVDQFSIIFHDHPPEIPC